MVRMGECPGCQMGKHRQHVRNYAPAPPGVMGGSMCGCKGECEERGPSRHIMKTVEIMQRAYRKIGR